MSEDCLVILDKWLIEQKNKHYTEHIKANNDENELQNYSDSLEQYAEKLIRAIEGELFSGLEMLGWPQELKDCIKDVGIRVDIIDTIESAFKRYPFNRSEIHRKELERENAGLQ